MFRTTIWGLYLYLIERANYGALYYLPQDSKVDINTIPSLHEPLNEKDFIRVNDNWRFFIAGNTKFISQDLKPLIEANLSDGYQDILGLRNQTSGKLMLLKELVLYLDDGKTLYESPGKFRKGVEYFKSKCWRFYPKGNLNDPDDINLKHTDTRFYSIDGERYPICPVQVKTMNKFLRVYSGKE